MLSVMLILPFFLLIAAPVPVSRQMNPEGQDVKIGLLIPDKNSKFATQGAELAIRKANENGGYKGNKFKLILRTMEGPWGTGSKQAVNLIFDENVCAIVGSHDGRNAHLVEQVSTKARIVFLSAWASDPGLSQAFVPWYFSCVPTDLQQSDAIINEVYSVRKIKNPLLVSDNGYDSKVAAESFLKRINFSGEKPPVLFTYGNSEKSFKFLADSIVKARPNGIIFIGKPSSSLEIIKLIKQRNVNCPMFGTLSLLNDDQDINSYGDLCILSPEKGNDKKTDFFRNEYLKAFGSIPGAVSEYSYDAVSILIDAIRQTGTDREAIRQSLVKSELDGVTGRIKFDEKGKRTDIPFVRCGTH